MMPEYLFSSNSWEWEIRNKKILLMLDFDGTLTPIVKNPQESYVSEELSKLLKDLKNFVKIAVISGRDVKDLIKRLSFNVDYFCGSHGLEIEGKDLHFKHPEVLKLKKIIDSIYKEIKKHFSNNPEIFIEKKTFSFVFHYRNVAGEKRKESMKRFLSIISYYFQQYPIKIQKGKMVFEVLPDIDWDKGKAIIFIMKFLNHQIYPIYVGDDQTDEYAFLTIKENGLTVRIRHSKRTSAKYFLTSYKEMPRFLKMLREALNG